MSGAQQSGQDPRPGLRRGDRGGEAHAAVAARPDGTGNCFPQRTQAYPAGQPSRRPPAITLPRSVRAPCVLQPVLPPSGLAFADVLSLLSIFLTDSFTEPQFSP